MSRIKERDSFLPLVLTCHDLPDYQSLTLDQEAFMSANYDLLLFQLAQIFWSNIAGMAGLIMCAALRGVTRFATNIDIETDPKCLNGIE